MSYSNRNRGALEATMFKANNVHMRDPTLNMTIHNEANVERRYALDLLRSNCSLAALVDANERYDPPRCAETTRRNIIQKMEDWICDDGLHSAPSCIFWLYGGAGAGKSALAQTLAEEFKTNEDLAASFFFFKTDVNRNNGDRLIPTLALQLVQSFQGLTPFVEEKILQNPDLFKKSRRAQMLELLVEPFIRLSLEETNGGQSALKSHPRLVVIDGLDECLDSNIQCDLLRIIASAIPHFPYPLRFLLTSRPESHITRTSQHDLSKVAQYNLSDDSDAEKDIRNFLEGEFAKICRTHSLRQHLPSQWPHSDKITPIVERSSGHFIYASTVIRFIQSPQHRPDDRLQVILGLKQPYEKDRPYASLDSLYSLIFLEIQDPGQLEKIHRALGIMHLRSMKKGLFAWTTRWTSDRHAIELLLELRPGDLVLLFDPLLSLVTFDGGDIRIFHKSLIDYLLNSNRSGDLVLDLGLAHEPAAKHVLLQKKFDSWDFAEFQHFAYHCQFAPLDDTLKGHLRALACDPDTTFTESLPKVLAQSEPSSLLQSILYLLQIIGRQDFDPSGHCYMTYVAKKTLYLRSALSLGQRMKCTMSRFMYLPIVKNLESDLRSSFKQLFESSDLKYVQLSDPNGFNGRTPIPAVDSSMVKSIEQEHEMFSSYIRARYRYPHVAVSFLEPNSEFIHSCHFVIRADAEMVIFRMLVTYTKLGFRLSCTQFSNVIILLRCTDDLVKEHYQSTRKEVSNNHTNICSR